MRRSLAALALAVVLPFPAHAGDVVVRPGETLSQIADRYGISVTRLIQLNAIRDPDHLEAGTTLKVPGASGGSRSLAAGSGGSVTVREGETLSEIADRHGISVTRLMQINGIDNPDHVEAGTRLKVGTPGTRSLAPSGAGLAYNRRATEHVVRPGESLSVIADGYGVPMSKLIAINGISNPNHVEEGTRLRLKAPAGSAKAAAATARPATATVKPNPKPAPVAAATPVARPVAAAAPVVAVAARSASVPEAGPRTSTPAPTTPVRTPAGTASAQAVSPAAGAPATTSVATAAIARPTAAQTVITPTATAQPELRPPAASAPATPRPAVTPTAFRPAPTAATATTATTATAITATATSTAAAVTPRASSPVTPRVAAVSASTQPASRTLATGGTAATGAVMGRPVATVATATASPARPPAKADWRTYGPLQIDWANWQPMGGSLVAPTLNSEGQSLYLAINCGARKLNATTQAGQWKRWDDPQTDFEEQMISDLCKARS